ncbi:dephospho-CoA kinase [Intestinibacter bartlettii]|uniref:Dephospho-CoA kinase n=1 Tax=Intestinibacter bartlettii TaxID=261299 RepID=A0ABS6DTW9_9FIRM|nr:dephospho-CoA kinase [Intestinibacter bartlettii]MBU5335272.1 dephospho-CoA kinase [Intestinibacter bartlettii]MDO5011591.1 dephospho-CoA kinase [Intestinibacter bartlettii]
MLVLGLTGNIGCGKSSVSTIFMENNINIVDADIVARQIFDDKDLLNEVFSTFGESIKNQDGSLNRKALANIVFNDDEKLITLNNLTHPKIKQKILSKVEEYKNQGEKIVVIDAALLIEDDYLPYIDKLILITCRKDIQINRIMARDNCTKEEAISRINSQMSQEDKAKFADCIIDNSNSFEELEKKVLELISVLQGEKE